MRILVDADAISSKGILSSPAAPIRSVEVDGSTLGVNIQRAVGEISLALAGIEAHAPGFKVGEIAFTLAVTGTGEVSLMSLLKASTSIQTGIQIKLQPKT